MTPMIGFMVVPSPAISVRQRSMRLACQLSNPLGERPP
jgi:hypothetical protein